MSRFLLARSDVRILLSHMALYGLAAILEEGGLTDVRVGWTSAMQSRPWVDGDALSRDIIDDCVRRHAHRRADLDCWVQRDTTLKGSARALMSPRLTPFTEPGAWSRVSEARHRELDTLTDSHAWSDLSYLAALGEPSYWSRNRQDQVLQDDGASRLEMQPRNQGSEFVGNRLRKLAASVGAREAGAVADGLDGTRTVDEIGGQRLDSRTATGLAGPGPTDNALAWCAMWGIGQVPIAVRPNASATTSCHLGRSRSEWFYAPVWFEPWRPARLRSILASTQLRSAATADLPDRWLIDSVRLRSAQAWLSARGVAGLMRFPIDRFGSDSAPERRAMQGSPVSWSAR